MGSQPHLRPRNPRQDDPPPRRVDRQRSDPPLPWQYLFLGEGKPRGKSNRTPASRSKQEALKKSAFGDSGVSTICSTGSCIVMPRRAPAIVLALSPMQRELILDAVDHYLHVAEDLSSRDRATLTAVLLDLQEKPLKDAKNDGG